MARHSGAYDVLEPIYSRYQVWKWNRAGRPVPAPSAMKRQLLRQTARHYDIRTLVETGTYKADTVRALRKDFSLIVSIELDLALYGAAVRRCKRQRNAHLYLGDSGDVLRDLMPTLHGRALFWLDAHYSGYGTACGEHESPIEAELECALAEGRHVVLIDDAREFRDPVNGYPPISLVHAAAARHGYSVIERDDVMMLRPVST